MENLKKNKLFYFINVFWFYLGDGDRVFIIEFVKGMGY